MSKNSYTKNKAGGWMLIISDSDVIEHDWTIKVLQNAKALKKFFSLS